MPGYRKGTDVEWDWGKGTASGRVEKTYTQKTTVKIKGTEITRDASKDDPAFLIEQEDGDKVLKSSSEIRRKP